MTRTYSPKTSCSRHSSDSAPSLSTQAEKPRSWIEFNHRIPDERNCLAAYLALESAEVMAGVKPANLIPIMNRTQSCGRNLMDLWGKHGEQVLADSPIRFRVMRQNDSSVLLLLYHPALLRQRITGKTGTTFLQKAGYPDPLNMEQTLAQLQDRITGEEFPHEIGFFLGYPLKDVTAFMGWTDKPVSGQLLWKIFGQTHRSLKIAQTYRSCRNHMANRLALWSRQNSNMPLSLADFAA